MDFMLIQSYLDKIPTLEELLFLPEIDAFSNKFSKLALENKINQLLDERHLLITTSKSEDDLKKLDFSMNFYIKKLNEMFVEERELGSKKIFNLMGTIYSKYLGDKFYSKKLLDEFSEHFTSYNTLNYDLKTSKGVDIKEEISNFFKTYNKEKDYIILSSVSSALYTILKVLYPNKNLICSVKESYTFSNGSDIVSVLQESGINFKMVGSINNISSYDYEKVASEDSVILDSDFFGNKLEGMASLSLAETEDLRKKYNNVFLSDKVYLDTGHEQISKFAYKLADLSKENTLLVLDLSKTEDFPEGAVIVGNKEDIKAIKDSVYTKLFALSKEAEVLYYLNLKNKISPEKEESYLSKVLAKDEELVRKSNERVINLLENQLEGLVELGLMEGPYLKVEEGVSYADSFNRELIVLKPLNKDASLIEKELRLCEPGILCLLNEGTLIFNLQLINEEDEKILVEKLVEVIK